VISLFEWGKSTGEFPSRRLLNSYSFVGNFHSPSRQQLSVMLPVLRFQANAANFVLQV